MFQYHSLGGTFPGERIMCQWWAVPFFFLPPSVTSFSLSFLFQPHQVVYWKYTTYFGVDGGGGTLHIHYSTWHCLAWSRVFWELCLTCCSPQLLLLLFTSIFDRMVATFHESPFWPAEKTPRNILIPFSAQFRQKGLPVMPHKFLPVSLPHPNQRNEEHDANVSKKNSKRCQ